MSIILEKLSYTYQDGALHTIPALRDINITIEAGEFAGIMGRTGCGKTTLIQLIAGLLSPTSGRVLINGRDIGSRSYPREELRRSVGVVFQYPECQLFETTVEKDVAFGLKHSGLSRSETAERVKQALETMDFDYESIRFQSPLSLSGGEKRRIAIAGVLAGKPEILIFDEPIAGLDPPGRERFLNLVKRLNRGGTTILMVSHNADALAEAAGRVIILKEGRLFLDGPPRMIFSDEAAMRGAGLGVSAPARLALQLNRAGLQLKGNIVRYDELLSAIKQKQTAEAPRPENRRTTSGKGGSLHETENAE